jgi:hypothetical protein
MENTMQQNKNWKNNIREMDEFPDMIIPPAEEMWEKLERSLQPQKRNYSYFSIAAASIAILLFLPLIKQQQSFQHFNHVVQGMKTANPDTSKPDKSNQITMERKKKIKKPEKSTPGKDNGTLAKDDPINNKSIQEVLPDTTMIQVPKPDNSPLVQKDDDDIETPQLQNDLPKKQKKMNPITFKSLFPEFRKSRGL